MIEYIKKTPIDEGWSKDKKYCLVASDGTKMFMRLSSVDSYERKKSEYIAMQKVAQLGVPMCIPIDFGISDEDIANNKYWVNQTSAGLGGYDLMYSDGEKIYCMVSASLPYGDDALYGNDSLFIGTYGSDGWEWKSNLDLSCAVDFVVTGNDVIYITDSALYEIDKENYSHPTQKLSFEKCVSVAFADGLLGSES